jgi:predicted phosphodiesterase
MDKKIIIGDVHLNKNKVSYFYSLLFPFIKQLNRKYIYDSVVFLGDIFTSSSIDNDTLKLFKDLITLFDNDIKIKILVGNHDMITNTNNIYDLLLLKDNIIIYDELCFQKNEIYIPYIIKDIEYSLIFNNIKEYIEENTNYENYYIYSHNDFSEIYKFRSNFFNIIPIFEKTNKNIYLINGHNHVPIFKKKNKFNILNLGCAINQNYNDSCDDNYFLYIENNYIKFLKNKYSIHYYTFHIWKDRDIYLNMNKLNKKNLSYIKFVIHNPEVVLDNNFKKELYEHYSIGDIQIEYELSSLLNLVKNNNDILDSTISLDSICEKFDIHINEFIKNNNEKIEILLSLLNSMFENRNTSTLNVTNVIKTVKKYLL